MPVAPSTRQHLDDHLGQAEFALKVVMNFDCLKATPAHESVRAALAQVSDARNWLRQNVAVEPVASMVAERAHVTAQERHRIVRRRMARLVP